MFQSASIDPFRRPLMCWATPPGGWRPTPSWRWKKEEPPSLTSLLNDVGLPMTYVRQVGW